MTRDEAIERAQRLREYRQRHPQTTVEFAGRALPMNVQLRRIERMVRRERLRRSSTLIAPSSSRRRARCRASRQRRVRQGSTGCRSPGRSDDDDPEPDLVLGRAMRGRSALGALFYAVIDRVAGRRAAKEALA
jgi:hypothetical protein